MVYRIRPLIDNQEFRGNGQGNDYWEGACEALDENGKENRQGLPRTGRVRRKFGRPPELNFLPRRLVEALHVSDCMELAKVS